MTPEQHAYDVVIFIPRSVTELTVNLWARSEDHAYHRAVAELTGTGTGGVRVISITRVKAHPRTVES